MYNSLYSCDALSTIQYKHIGTHDFYTGIGLKLCTMKFQRFWLGNKLKLSWITWALVLKHIPWKCSFLLTMLHFHKPFNWLKEHIKLLIPSYFGWDYLHKLLYLNLTTVVTGPHYLLIVGLHTINTVSLLK